MTNAGIEAFLIVCKQHSISKAAAELFISQSSLSIRLRTLEKEVGCPLFFRHKGSREMVLTEEGKRFYQLSLQYQDIVRSMLAIGNRKSSLRLSALNSVSTYLLPPVYEQFMRDHPDIHLEIQDMTVEAACQSLLRGETDLAFTSDVPRTDAIRAELVMAEPMDLICAAGSCYSDGIGPDELPARQEVYVEWTDEFARWHQELWGVDAVPRIQLEIMSQLQMFMTKRVAEGRHWKQPLPPPKQPCRRRQITACKMITNTTIATITATIITAVTTATATILPCRKRS